jgi:hypothetical protein
MDFAPRPVDAPDGLRCEQNARPRESVSGVDDEAFDRPLRTVEEKIADASGKTVEGLHVITEDDLTATQVPISFLPRYARIELERERQGRVNIRAALDLLACEMNANELISGLLWHHRLRRDEYPVLGREIAGLYDEVAHVPLLIIEVNVDDEAHVAVAREDHVAAQSANASQHMKLRLRAVKTGSVSGKKRPS